jgi:hypothetical protein
MPDGKHSADGLYHGSAVCSSKQTNRTVYGERRTEIPSAIFTVQFTVSSQKTPKSRKREIGRSARSNQARPSGPSGSSASSSTSLSSAAARLCRGYGQCIWCGWPIHAGPAAPSHTANVRAAGTADETGHGGVGAAIGASLARSRSRKSWDG